MSVIMVIDDDDALLQLYQELLGESGYTVILRGYLPQDVADVQLSAPDLLILDFLMRGRTSTQNFLEQLRSTPSLADLPILVCSAAITELAAHTADLQRLRATVLTKPFDIDELIAVVQYLLAQTGHKESDPRAQLAGSPLPAKTQPIP